MAEGRDFGLNLHPQQATTSISVTAATPVTNQPLSVLCEDSMSEQLGTADLDRRYTRSRSSSPPPQYKWRLSSESKLHKSQSVDVLSESTKRKTDSEEVHRRSSNPQDGISGGSAAYKQKEGLLDTLFPLKRSSKKRSSKKTKDVEHPLHYPKNAEVLIEFLKDESIDVNARDDSGYGPIHAIVASTRKKSPSLLMALLTHSDADVNLCTTLCGSTALHLAVVRPDIKVVKILLAFEADVNALNHSGQTPLDISLEAKQMETVDLLVSFGGNTSDLTTTPNFNYKLPRLKSFHDEGRTKARLKLRRQQRMHEQKMVKVIDNYKVFNGFDSTDSCPVTYDEYQCTRIPIGVMDEEDRGRERTFSMQSCESATLKDMEDGRTLTTLYERLQQCINVKLEFSGSYSGNTDEDVAITMQQKELLKYKKTAQEAPASMFQIRGGSRILFLDGGGMRGLIQIEILRNLEKQTGRRVTELFDWIVGTSTGGVLALGLVYGKKSLCELRQLYLKIKDEVFANDRLGFAYNTAAFERLLKKVLGTELCMNDIEFPRVLISAVYKKTTIPELHFFNNCFGDEFSTQPVWKVARYTSAAPMLFSEFENYVDGGVLANNPSDFGLSAIQNFHRQIGVKLDIALVVSVGCGIYPAEELGKIDAQEFLFFGKHWFKIGHALKKRAKNLIQLLTTALVESEAVAVNARSRLKEMGIPFYRMSPRLDHVIPSGETDTDKLLDMIIRTKTVEAMSPQMDELVQMFYLVAEMNRKLNERKKCEENLKHVMSA